MKTSKAVIVFVSMFLVSCALVQNQIPSPHIAQKKSTELKLSPPIGKVNSAEIGENLYNEYRVTTRQPYTAKVMEEAYGEMDQGNKIRIKEGAHGDLMETWANQYFALCFDYITIGGLFGASHACLVDVDGKGSFNYAAFKNNTKLFPLLKPAKYALIPKGNTKVEVEDASDFKRVVLYNGLSKGTIKISFREFIKDMARPAFTQDVSYDLENDGTTVIAFKGLRIEVLSAIGANIKYKVLQPFSDSATSAPRIQ